MAAIWRSFRRADVCCIPKSWMDISSSTRNCPNRLRGAFRNSYSIEFRTRSFGLLPRNVPPLGAELSRAPSSLPKASALIRKKVHRRSIKLAIHTPLRLSVRKRTQLSDCRANHRLRKEGSHETNSRFTWASSRLRRFTGAIAVRRENLLDRQYRCRCQSLAHLQRDRKSTRLNSSHMSI